MAVGRSSVDAKGWVLRKLLYMYSNVMNLKNGLLIIHGIPAMEMDLYRPIRCFITNLVKIYYSSWEEDVNARLTTHDWDGGRQPIHVAIDRLSDSGDLKYFAQFDIIKFKRWICPKTRTVSQVDKSVTLLHESNFKICMLIN